MVHIPSIRVALRTSNPLLLVAEIRERMRRVGVSREAIHQFSSEALGGDSADIRKICSQWVNTDSRPSEPPPPQSGD